MERQDQELGQVRHAKNHNGNVQRAQLTGKDNPIENTSPQRQTPKLQSISRRFSFAFIGVVTLLLFGFAAVVIFINVSETEKELERRLDYSLNLSTTSLPKALWNLDNDVVEDLVAALFLDQAIIHVRVMWGKQVISEQTRKNFHGTDFSDPDRSSSLIIKTSEISVESQKLGTIRISMSRESVRKKLIFNIAGIVALTTLIILGISWTSIVITKRYISRPLSRIQASATSIAHGNLEAPIEINGRDEIGTLARDLNVMRESIKELFEETRESNEKLEEYGRTLEQRVEERTVELAEKSNTLEQLSNQLAKYLSPQIYDSIFLSKQEVKIASSRKKLTVFFSDIADFTETADRLQSEELTELLNQYLTEMSQIALEYGATVDKYVGDAIVIFFGDPESKGVKEDALACVKMSIAMRWRMNELQHVWRDSGIDKAIALSDGHPHRLQTTALLAILAARPGWITPLLAGA